MKKLLKILLLSAILMFTLSIVISCGNNNDDDGGVQTPPPTYTNKLEYLDNGNEITITGIRILYQTDVEIPSEIDGKPVTTIGERAFDAEKKTMYSNITSVTVGSNLKYIKNRAFFGCQKLSTFNVGGEIEELGDSAFENCSELTAFALSGKTTIINPRAFYGCKKLSGINLQNVTRINDNAFNSCGQSITEFTVTNSNSLINIGDGAFKNCSVKQLTLPETLESIGISAFEGSFLTSITIPSKITDIATSAFQGCLLLESLTLGSNVASIGTYSFKMCVKLENIIFSGNKLTTIGVESFSNCGLKSLSIPNCVKTIDTKAFVGCTSLSTVVIGSGVKTIGAHAFSDGTTEPTARQHLTSLTINSKGWYYDNSPENTFESEEMKNGQTLASTYWSTRQYVWKR